MPPQRDLSLHQLREAATVHHSRWVLVGILAVVSGYAISLGTEVITGSVGFPGAYTDIGALALGLVALALFLRGHIAPAMFLTIFTVWAEIQTAIIIDAGQHHVGSLPVFPLLIAGAALLLGERISMRMAVLTCVTAPLAIGLGRWRGGGTLTPIDVHQMVILDFSMLTMAALTALFLRSFGEVLGQAVDSEGRFADLFRNAPDGIVSIDAAGRVDAVNPAGAALLAVNASEAVGRPLGEILPPAADGSFPGGPQALASLLTGGAGAALAVKFAHPDGREVACDVIARPAVRADGSSGTQVVFRDVSERHAAEVQAAQLSMQLQQAQKLDAVGRLAGGIAHDFNNLLMVIGANVELLQETADPRARELGARIANAQARGTALTRQLLALARRDVGNPRVLDLAAQVREAQPVLRKLIGEARTLVLEAERPAWVSADPGQVDQILLNLVGNARDATPEGGRISVEVAPPAEDDRDPRMVTWRVSDTGAGMNAEVRQRIFEPFFTTKGRGKGTGLGLAMVHGLVTHHGGRIGVESAPGAGTIMTIEWPACAAPDEALAAGAVAGSTRTDRVAGTVLLVEDDQQARNVIRQLLERIGYRVFEASEGAAGLEVVGREAIDVVLTDVVMPGMGGLELARRLGEERPGLRVVLMSGYLDDPQLSESVIRDLPLLLKPFRSDDLRQALARVMAGDA